VEEAFWIPAEQEGERATTSTTFTTIRKAPARASLRARQSLELGASQEAEEETEEEQEEEVEKEATAEKKALLRQGHVTALQPAAPNSPK
jgi:hypothetical protein